MNDQTPVTDLSRRARDWAERRHPTEGSPDWFAAKYILDTVPVPTMTLADEIREEGAGRPPGAVKRVNALADRAEAVEKENKTLAARVEGVEDEAAEMREAECDLRDRNAEWRQDARRFRQERDEARAEVEEVKGYLSEAYQQRDVKDAEVERLMQEREQQEKALVEHGRLLSEARAERDRARTDCIKEKTRNRNLESDYQDVHAEVERLTRESAARLDQINALEGKVDRMLAVGSTYPADTLPDPADVPEGEAWIVEVEGEEEHLLGLRNGGEPHAWETFSFTTRGSGGWCADTAVTLVARLSPDTRRVIDKPEDLVKLPSVSVILDGASRVCEKSDSGRWLRLDGLYLTAAEVIESRGPVTVIYEPMSDSGDGRTPDCPTQG